MSRMADARVDSGLPSVNLAETSRALESELQAPVGIVYFGQSPKRDALLRFVAKQTGLAFRRLPGGEEDNTLFSAQIAAAKIDHGLSEELPKIIRSSKKSRVAVAGDVTILLQTIGAGGKIIWDKKGKPEHLRADFQEVLQQMIETVGLTRDRSYYSYSIDAASESRLIEGLDVKRTASVGQFVHVGLSEGAVKHFATKEGTQEYMDESRRFLMSPQYRNGLVNRQLATPAEACAGFEIAVFEKFKAIASIDGVKRNDTKFAQRLRSAFWAAYVGIDPEVLGQIHPDAPQLATQWPWLDQIMEYANAT